MKKVFLVMLGLALGLGMMSCSSDDDSGPMYSIVGKWKITQYTINGDPFEECSLNGIRQFKNDGVYLQDDYELDENGECKSTEDSPLIGTYQWNGNNLKTILPNEEISYKIEFQNNTHFTLTDTYNNVDFVYYYAKQ